MNSADDLADYALENVVFDPAGGDKRTDVSVSARSLSVRHNHDTQMA